MTCSIGSRSRIAAMTPSRMRPDTRGPFDCRVTVGRGSPPRPSLGAPPDTRRRSPTLVNDQDRPYAGPGAPTSRAERAGSHRRARRWVLGRQRYDVLRPLAVRCGATHLPRDITDAEPHRPADPDAGAQPDEVEAARDVRSGRSLRLSGAALLVVVLVEPSRLSGRRRLHAEGLRVRRRHGWSG